MKKKNIKKGSFIKCRKTGAVGIVVDKISETGYLVKVDGQLMRWIKQEDHKQKPPEKRSWIEKLVDYFKR